MLVSEHKIYECEVGNAVGYYRSYNEDSFFEWECFAVEINKQIKKLKGSINEAKAYEIERRFDARGKNLHRILEIKQNFIKLHGKYQLHVNSVQGTNQQDDILKTQLTTKFSH